MLKFSVLLFIMNFKSSFFKRLPFKYFPISGKKIVFSNYVGMGYGCNPKYIAELLLKKHPDIKIIWLVNEKDRKFKFPPQIKKVKNLSIRAFYEMNTAKIWIDNFHKVGYIKEGLKKRKGQYYIQTWHGSLGIKKIEADVHALTNTKSWENTAVENAKMQDYLLSNSSFEDRVYRSAFWGYGEILRTGHARNDIFFKDNKDLRIKILDELKLSSDTKFALYVPTFRQGYSTKIYNVDYERLKKSLEERFGGEWVIFVRLHRNIKTGPDLRNFGFVYNLSAYDDVQELLASADCAITDYSSCIFDFVLTRKPGFIYAPDIEKYNQERGFYYSLYDTPFPVARDNDELVFNIKTFDNNLYLSKVGEFLKEKGCVDDGSAALRTVNLVEKLLDK